MQTTESSSPVPESEDARLELLTRPSAALVAFATQVRGPLVVLGAGGKMGPTLCVMARRAAEAAGHPLEVVAVSRFSDAAVRRWLEASGVKTVSCDLLERSSTDSLPDSENVVSLVGLKFGTARDPASTWAVNVLATTHVAERYRQARIVALSTGNVYPMVPVSEGGAREDHPLTPLGEYANAAVARERILEYLSRRHHTPIAILRLSFAVELRYGVLVDIGRRVWEGRPISLRNGWVNWIWQGDANDRILRALALASVPAKAWNLTHPRPLRVRDVANRFAAAFEREAILTDAESDDALLSNPASLGETMGEPPTSADGAISRIAEWIRNGGADLEKPTHFDVRDGRY